MDGTIETPPPPAPTPLVELPPAEIPRAAPVLPPPPAPVAFEPPSPLEPSFVLPSDPVAPSPVVSPVPAPVAAAPTTDATSLRNTLLAAFVGATVASGGLGYYLLRPHTAKAPANHEIEVPPPAPAPVAAPVAAPVVEPVATPAVPAAAVAPVATAPVMTPAPVAPPTPAAEKPAPKPKRVARRAKRKPKPAPVPVERTAAPADDGNGGGESLIESRVNSMDGAAAEPKAAAPAPSAPLAPPEGDKPAEASAEAASSAPDGGFMLPGVPRPVAAKSVVKAKNATQSAPAPKPSVASAPAAGDAAAAPAVEDETTHQVREQFEFCTQLLSQGAFDDHFDTCLCAETRNGAPYRGRRGLYAASLKKSAAAGKLETSATISSIVLDGAVAKVVAKWKAGPDDKERELTERWQLEDGLWCRAP
jgi:hypothetical protein